MAHRCKFQPAALPPAEEVRPEDVLRGFSDGQYRLICVLGPTASGKTKYAVRLAGELKALSGRDVEIISADSRQVYRGMDIGTGKDLAEYGDIPYHLIDIAEPGDGYNVFRFKEDFLRVWKDILERGGIPILCGGTGMYINAVTAGYDFSSKKPLSEARDSAGIATFFIGTLVERDERNARIDRRLDVRLAEGMIEEIRGLLQRGVPAETLISYGLEYKFVTQHILGELDFEQMRTLLSTAIHQFAKRQMTWFRGMERSGVRIHWVRV